MDKKVKIEYDNYEEKEETPEHDSEKNSEKEEKKETEKKVEEVEEETEQEIKQNVKKEEEKIKHPPQFNHFDTLVLSGGAIKSISILGALEYCYTHKITDNIVNYIGTSAGAIICYLIAIGYTPEELISIVCSDSFFYEQRNLDLVTMINNNGATSFNPIRELLEKLTIKKVGKYLTMEGLYKLTGKKLICCTYNITDDKTEYIGPDTHSDVPCLTALRMTANLPLIFSHFKYMGSFYVDGGITVNFPILKGAELGKKVLGIYLDSEKNDFSNDINSNILQYIYKLMFVPIRKSTIRDVNDAPDKCTIVSVDSNDIKLFDFVIDNSKKLDMFSDGYRKMQHHFEG